MPPHSAPASFGGFSQPATSPLPAVALDDGLARSRRHLLGLQRPDGHWCAELEGDTILESEFILLQAILGRLGDPRIAKCARYLIAHQQSDGGWNNYPGGASDLSVTAKAYFALKIAGHPPDAPAMARARQCVHALGGAENVNSFTRFYFALLGQIPYSSCPTVPPELVLLPKWFPLSIYKMSSWSRTIVVPLALVQAHRPVTPLPANLGIKELFRAPGAEKAPPPAARIQGRFLSWQNFFRLADRGLKVYEKLVPVRWRRRAIKAAEKWMIDRFEGSDGLGAIFPPMVYAILALKALGYPESSAEFKWAEKQLDDLIIEENDAIRVQPCVSPVWDTAMVLLALRRTSRFGDVACQHAVRRALVFLEAMRSSDNGWAAFDKDIDNKVLEAVPFADHNAMLDPTCADITARVLEMFGDLGRRRGDPMVDASVQYLLDKQEPEGCWYGRWGVNYIYGTWQALLGLAAVGYDMRHPKVRKAVDWLVLAQQSSGGWGESADTYIDRNLMGKGPATASQTGWAVMGLIAAGDADTVPCRRGVEYLLENQRPDGSWDEPEFTGTGFPKVFYLRYHYYRNCFPLLALGRYRAATAGKLATTDDPQVLPMNRRA